MKDCGAAGAKGFVDAKAGTAAGSGGGNEAAASSKVGGGGGGKLSSPSGMSPSCGGFKS